MSAPTQRDAADVIASTFDGATIIGKTAAGKSFLDRAARADVIEGHTLEKEKANLIGIPLLITGITVRDGKRRNKELTNYVNAEAIVADKVTLLNLVDRKRITREQYNMIVPEESIVINDGSTGIARQLVAYLHGKGLIEVPAGPESGSAGTCRWDTYRAGWIKGYSLDNPDPRFTVELLCPRGLRVSEYVYDDDDEAETFYLA